MILTKLLIVASASVFSQNPGLEVKKNQDGSVAFSLPKGAKEGVYIADTSYVMVVKPSEELAKVGIDANDHIIEACGKSLTTSELSNREKVDLVELKNNTECVFKVNRRNSLLYISVKRKQQP